MVRFRSIRMVVLVVMFFLLPSSVFPGETAWAQESIIGIWSASVRTKGGLGNQLTFHERNDVSYTFGALVDFNYSINKSQLSMKGANPESEKNSESIKQQFSINGSTLTIQDEGSEESQIMDWAGIPVETKNKHPIVGNWTYWHYTGQMALMRYSSHGLAQLSVPAIVKNGTYSIKEDKIVVKYRDEDPKEYTYKRNGKRLTLHDVENEKIIEFQLFEY